MAKDEKQKPLDWQKMYSFNDNKIETGVIPLDCVLGGGYEKGDIIEWSSPSGVGKSTAVMFVMRNRILQAGERIAYLDIEKGVKVSTLTNMGIADKVTAEPGEKNQLVFSKPDTYKSVDQALEELICKYHYDHVVLDSITALISERMQEGNVEDDTIGVDARLTSKLLCKYKSACRMNGAVLWLINQTRTKMESHGKGAWKRMDVFEDSAGGKALQFYPDVRLRMRAGPQMKREEHTVMGVKDVIYGNEAVIWAVKNRAERPMIEIPMSIIFGVGVSNTAFLLEVMKVNELVETRGSFFFIHVEKMGMGSEHIQVKGIDGLLQWLKTNFQATKTYLKNAGLLKLTRGVAQ